MQNKIAILRPPPSKTIQTKKFFKNQNQKINERGCKK